MTVALRSGATLIEFRYGDRRILTPRVFPDLTRATNLESVARANRLDLLWLREPEGLFAERWNRARLEREYADNALLSKFYDDIRAVQEHFGVSLLLMMGDGGYWHREFVETARRRCPVAFWTADDPNGSELTSKPFVGYYDFAFCGGVYFDETDRITERFCAWGARQTAFIPLGACADKYRDQGGRSDEEFFTRGRDIDLIYVGVPTREKLWRILTLKRRYRDRFLLAGRRWDGRGLGWRGLAIRVVRALSGLGEIREVDNEELVFLYQRTRIGFNCHLTYGPSNLRTYELALNGVMQLCDCPRGLSELYEPFKEVVPYETTGEAIDRIDYYLTHEHERVEVARGGYARAMQAYRTEQSFARLLAVVDNHRRSASHEARERF